MVEYHQITMNPIESEPYGVRGGRWTRPIQLGASF
jgi:hypothetical protein